MQVTIKQNGPKVWVGAPKLESAMGIDHGMIVLRCRDKRLLNKLVATALVKNTDSDMKTFYIYSAPDFLNAYADFITNASRDLGLDWEFLMHSTHFLNFSTTSPARLHGMWTRLAEDSENTRLVVLDSVGHSKVRDTYLVENINRLCHYKNALALILDSSEEIDPTLERLAAVVVDLDVRGERGIEVFLRKHPKIPQTVFLMSP